MNGPILTPWFKGSVKPVRPGVYQRMFPTGVLHATWTGHQWLRARRTAFLARHTKDVSLQQVGLDCVSWRGLAYDPNA